MICQGIPGWRTCHDWICSREYRWNMRTGPSTFCQVVRFLSEHLTITISVINMLGLPSIHNRTGWTGFSSVCAEHWWNENQTADQLISWIWCPLTGSKQARGTSERWLESTMNNGSLYLDKGIWQASFRNPLQKTNELWGISRNLLRHVTGIYTGHCHLKGHPFTLGLLNSPSVKSATTKKKQPQYCM